MIKKFAAYYKPHKKLFYVDMLFSFLVSVFNLVFPIFTRNMLYTYIPHSQWGMLIRWTIIMLLLFVVQYISIYIVNYYGHGLGVKIEEDMRRDLFEHLQTLPLSFYDQHRTGHIMSRLVNDLRDITELAHHGPENLFISGVMIIGSCIILAQVDWRLALVLFAFVPVMIAFIINRKTKMERAFSQVREKIADINSQVENAISGVRVSKSFSNEDYELEKFQESNQHYSQQRNVAYKVMAEYAAGMGVIQSFLNLLVLLVGGYFVYRQVMPMENLIMFLLYINFFMQPIRRLTDFAQQYHDGMTGFARFQEIMDIKPSIIDAPTAVELQNVNGHIVYNGVSFAYDNGEQVLSDIDLDIAPGTTMAIVGPSGAGKTTLCHLLPRFYEVTAGTITIDDQDIRDVTLNSLRRHIGLVQQDVFLFTGTIRENILYGKPEATDAEVIMAAKRANIHDFINTLPQGYDTYIGEKGVMLSGGQKQRVSIARIFLKAPPILILDEATSALDNETEKIIQVSLSELAEGRTSLIIAHRLSTIQHADEIVVLTEEGVVERGSHDELMQLNGEYANLYRYQFSTGKM